MNPESSHTNEFYTGHVEFQPSQVEKRELRAFDLDLLPEGEDFMHLLPTGERHTALLARQRDRFNSSDRVLVPNHTSGIGDSIINASIIFATARANPAKEFRVIMHPALSDRFFSRLLQKPHNTTVCNPSTAIELHDLTYILSKSPVNSDFLLQLEYENGFQNVFRIAREKRMARFRKDVKHKDLLLIAQDVYSKNDARNVSIGNVNNSFEDKALSTGIKQKDVRLPLFNLESVQPNTEYDFLIFPEAESKPVQGYEHGNRFSRGYKCLNLDQWEAISKRVPKNARVAIAPGRSYKDYSNVVVEIFQQSHQRTDVIRVSSFSEFVPYILSARRVITMDSAPAHLTSAVIKSLQTIPKRSGENVSSTPTLRVVHNATAFRYQTFGVHGHKPGVAQTLVFDVPEKRDILLDSIPSDLLAEFMFE